MYVRQLGWLNATPEKAKKSRAQTFREISEDHSSLRLPDIGAAVGLVELWQEAGSFLNTGMGPVPLTWSEIDAWMRVTKRNVPVWARTLIRNLSETYVQELTEARDPSRPAPFVDNTYIDRQRVSDGLKKLFRGMAKKNKGG